MSIRQLTPANLPDQAESDLKRTMELLAERGPAEARRLLDPALERMMETVDRPSDELQRAGTMQVQIRAGISSGEVVTVVGEPRLCKSRLYYEFTHSHAHRRWLVLGLILEASSVSYGKATP
jgi:hypothetical protein